MYKEGLVSEWGIKKFNLDDLYVRFFRIAERRIVDRKPNKGIVCYISNYSYLGDPSFVVMRKRFLNEFDELWFDCMNGDARETGKLTPEGKPDPSVFSTEHNREGIRVGTTIGLLIRKGPAPKSALVRFRHFWGSEKRQELLLTLENAEKTPYQIAVPRKENRLSFRPSNVQEEYLAWPTVTQLSLVHPFNGPVERRGNTLIVFENERKKLRMVRDYLDPAWTDEQILAIAPRFMTSSGEFDAPAARAKLKGKVTYAEKNIRRYPFKPFDVRLSYLDASIQPLFSRPSPELLRHSAIPRNRFLITRDTADQDPEGSPFLWSSVICDYDSISGHARHFPLEVEVKTATGVPGEQRPLMDVGPMRKVQANISTGVEGLLTSLGMTAEKDASNLVWLHVLGIGYSPTYLSENADGIRQDWPRVPLPNSRELLEASATLGEQVAALLDTEAPVEGVTAGEIREELRNLGMVRKVTKAATAEPQEDQLQARDLGVTVGWGHAGKGGITMPGKGMLLEGEWTPAQREAIAAGVKRLGLSEEQALAQIGEKKYCVFLNQEAYWENVPQRVWEYTIGGYQVIKKWLSYREEKLLGRKLTIDEARYVTEMVRRIAAICLLQPALDTNYRAVKGNTYAWNKQ